MQAGKLNTRISVTSYNRVQDEFGGWNNTEADVASYWCNFEPIKGDVSQVSGKRSLSTEAKIVMRKKAAENINIGDTIKVNSLGNSYRINDKYDSVLDFYTEIIATKIE